MKIDPRDIELIDDKTVEILGKKTGGERMLMAAQMFETARILIRSNIVSNHPDWSEEQVVKELRRRLGNEPD